MDQQRKPPGCRPGPATLDWCLRYERGEIRQGKALDKLLCFLDRHPDLLDEIRVKDAA
ncbi:MAG TPA: hypothetical protein DEB35_03250 [Desulfuromonas sp.]|nr:hypothetical protein [Desulfuromonas sp.]